MFPNSENVMMMLPSSSYTFVVVYLDVSRTTIGKVVPTHNCASSNFYDCIELNYRNQINSLFRSGLLFRD